MTSTQPNNDLTEVSKNALKDYDDLLSKYNKLVLEHQEIKDELDQLQEVAGPMYDEYGQMHTKYEMEKSLRTAAETFATKVLKDNKKIKRESAMLAAHMSSAKPIAIDINIEDCDSVQDERIEELGNTITKLQDEVANYKVQLEKARDEISILTTQADQIIVEREEYKFKCHELEKDVEVKNIAVRKHQRELNSLNRASRLTVGDYSSMEEKYAMEKTLRLKAEAYASELQRKRDSLLEPSQVTASADNEDEALTKLKVENDKLHEELTELEIKYKSQMEELEMQLNDSSSHKTVENLEEKLEVVKEDMERLTEELESQKKENQTLTEKIAKAERERQQALNIPLPPPPPPPPGPAAGIGRLIISKKKKKDQKLTKIVGTAAVKDDTMKSAIDEMMARIKAGNKTLRRVDMNTRPEDMQPANDSDGAMTEMHKYLVSMKQKKRARSPQRTENVPSELQKILAVRRDRSNSVDMLKDVDSRDDEKQRSNSVGQESAAKEIAKRLNKQASLDTPPVPKPKPKPRLSQKAPKADSISNELASKLHAALERIPGDDTKT